MTKNLKQEKKKFMTKKKKKNTHSWSRRYLFLIKFFKFFSIFFVFFLFLILFFFSFFFSFIFVIFVVDFSYTQFVYKMINWIWNRKNKFWVNEMCLFSLSSHFFLFSKFLFFFSTRSTRLFFFSIFSRFFSIFFSFSYVVEIFSRNRVSNDVF